MSKRDVARMWVQEITGGRKPRLCIEKGEDNLVVVATFESTNHSKYFEEIIHEMCEELKQYRVIGTVSEFRELREKATAKKPVYSNFDENGEVDENGKEVIIPYKAVCPACGYEFEFGTWNDEQNHHCECGQRMLWG